MMDIRYNCSAYNPTPKQLQTKILTKFQTVFPSSPRNLCQTLKIGFIAPPHKFSPSHIFDRRLFPSCNYEFDNQSLLSIPQAKCNDSIKRKGGEPLSRQSLSELGSENEVGERKIQWKVKCESEKGRLFWKPRLYG
ncbi:hypothetical protein LXL04_039035 [Taraxacum kok-saghyz]